MLQKETIVSTNKRQIPIPRYREPTDTSNDAGEYGPKMLQLTKLQRRFVEASFLYPGKNPTEWARKAGYADSGNHAHAGIRVQAHILWHDRRIQEAIREEAEKRLTGLLPLANQVHLEEMLNPQNSGSERLKAVQMLYDRTGLHSHTEQKVTHHHIMDDKEKIARLEALARKLGVPSEKLIGRTLALKRPAVDAEFTEIVDVEDFV